MEPESSSGCPRVPTNTIPSRSHPMEPVWCSWKYPLSPGRSTCAVLTLDGEPAVEPLLDTDFVVDDAHLSPDGRWLAYESNASGAFEVYVRPFPNVEDRRWQVSSGGGAYALWGPDGHELFFKSPADDLMRVEIDTEPEFRAGNPERIVEAGSYYVNLFYRSFDISPDGQRFLMIKQGAASGADDPFAGLTRLIVVENWFEELTARVPVN